MVGWIYLASFAWLTLVSPRFHSKAHVCSNSDTYMGYRPHSRGVGVLSPMTARMVRGSVLDFRWGNSGCNSNLALCRCSTPVSYQRCCKRGIRHVCATEWVSRLVQATTLAHGHHHAHQLHRAMQRACQRHAKPLYLGWAPPV